MDNIDSFIFDLDGTLLDTVEDIKVAVNYAMHKCKIREYSKSEIISFVGHGSRYLIQCALKEHVELFDYAFKTYYDYYVDHFCDHTVLYPHILEGLEYAKSKNIKLFIYTNKPYDMTNSLIDKYFKEDMFLKVVSIKKDCKLTKPDPTLFLKETSQYNIDYGRSYYFGDSEVDIITSANLNIENMVSVSYGYKSKEFLLNYNVKPKYIIDNPKQIIDIIDNKNMKEIQL